MRTVAMIQARMTSTRLPGKVMMDINQKPMLRHLVDRVRLCQSVNEILIVTSLDSSDDCIVDYCKLNNIACYRGSLDDVLGRFLSAARAVKAEQIVRLTADCPLMPPDVVDDVVRFHLRDSADYTNNCGRLRFPDGMDVEVISIQALEKSALNARWRSEREHVTLFIENNPSEFKISCFDAKADMENIRLTVDYKEDLEVIKIVDFRQMGDFSFSKVLSVLSDDPSIKRLNGEYALNEGLHSSLATDCLLEINEDGYVR